MKREPKMTLGYQPALKPEAWPYSAHGWVIHMSGGGRYWPKPYEDFHERIAIRRRYRSGPRPWSPGRYTTSMWQPWSGYGRFSEIRDRLRGAYHAERYTGVALRPEHHIRDLSGPERYAEMMATDFRKRSWRISP